MEVRHGNRCHGKKESDPVRSANSKNGSWKIKRHSRVVHGTHRTRIYIIEPGRGSGRGDCY